MSKLLTAPLSLESWPRSLRVAGLVLAWLALAVQFHTPVREQMQPTLDGSNFASYAYFTAHHFQYGTEVVPMAGPYGFIMFGSVYGGDLFTARVIGELLLNAVLAALTLWFFRQLRGSWLRWAWLAAQVAFTPYVADLPLEWILLLGGLYLLRSRDESRVTWRDLLVTAVLALVSLVKGTQFILGLATLGVVLGGFAGQRRWRQAGQLAAGYFVALLFFWLLAGQNPLHLPAFLRGMLELGGGYTDAMSLLTPPEAFTRALLVTAGLAAVLGWALWYRRREILPVAALLLLAGHTFVQWKHGIVRSDAHALIYFNYAFVAALTIHLVAWHGARESDLVRWRGAGLLAVTLVLANWGNVELTLGHWENAPRLQVQHLLDNGRRLLALRDARDMLEGALRSEQQKHPLDLVREKVGDHAIDGFGYEQGLLPLNGLNYRPRPMGGGSFNVYTPYLMELNRRFLADDSRRPDFYLLKPQSIDERFLTADDGPALLEILRRYQPVLLEHEHLLLAARTEVPAGVPRRVHRTTLRFGEKVDVPVVGDDEMVLARFVIRPNWRGRLRSFLYKLPPVFLELADAGGKPLDRRRIVPAMAAAPFLLSPLVNTVNDVVDLYEPRAGRTLGQLRFSTPNTFPFAPIIDVEFFAAPRPVPLAPAALAEVRSRLRFPFANVEPATITPPFRSHLSVRYLHAPAEAVWPLAGGERSFAFHYGIDPEAYEKGTTNGVDFILEIRGPTGAPRVIFQRALKPRTQPADRGDQAATVVLPVFAAGSRLVLRTDPGEYGDNSWDWAYVNRIALRAEGSYPASLFPGFNRVPDFADAENAAAIETEGTPALLLHVPGKVGFKLTGRERRLVLRFGFLPGAYANGGQTTGADYVVELAPAGQPPREILRRRLRPLTEAADRGSQTATLDLPAVAAGDVLTLRTTPGPSGDSGWGWTYVSSFVLE